MQPIVCGLLLALLPFAAQAQLSESFTDGNFTQNPPWQGMDSSFEVKDGKLRSRHSQPNSTFYLSTASAAALNVQWEFQAHLDLNPSGLNYADVYLAAQTPQLSAGYFVRIGHSADDVSLYYNDGKGQVTRLIDGQDGVADHVLQVRVTRTAAGEWGLYTDGVEEGKVRDVAYMSSGWFGIQIRQSTASFFGKHFFDDIIIKELDLTPPYVAKRYDVLIHEIMADPSPPANLPDAEYIELRNVSGGEINLGGWLLKGRSIHAVLPAYKLLPDSVVVVASSSNTSLFRPSLGGGSSFSLSNEGELLALYDSKGRVIHAIDYRTEWYGGGIRAQGGWSLEMKDVKWPCAGGENFGAGGSPGRKNTIEGNITAPGLPQLSRISVIDSLHLRLHYTAGLDSASASHMGIAEAPLFTTLMVRLPGAMLPGKIYNMSPQGLKDCNGRELPAAAASYALPQEITAEDLVLSELLFDPPQGVQDFVELYNRSAKAIDLNGLYLAQRDELGVLKTPLPLLRMPYLLMPGEHIAFTEDVPALCRYYACPGRVETIPALPSMPQDAGTIVLLKADGLVLDEFSYHKNMHAGILHDTRGVSLERLMMEQPAQEPGNWHSAASAAGYATPGYRNSQHAPEMPGAEWFSVTPAVFSPDNDGMEDLAYISWNLPGAGFTVNITVYDADGRTVRQLARNLLAGNTGSISWDGRREGGMAALPGVYIIFIRAFDGSGKVKAWKHAVALKRK
ncbi:lamin tail domain-containing protein [Chitinophaga sp. 22620]|uniref:lamin tail domain-containing protein n=1 Tax=Chitinophaga sp. 22620 TaxID=3453952 RepID=UPI003F878771